MAIKIKGHTNYGKHTLPQPPAPVPYTCIDEHFNGGATPPAGWIFTNIVADTVNYGLASPSLRLKTSVPSFVITSTIENVSEISFWYKANMGGKILQVQGSKDNGANWELIQQFSVPTTATIETITGIASGYNRIEFYTPGGIIYFDDVKITCLS